MTTRVLVVDDEPQIRRALSINLRAHGYQVDLAQDGEHALELAARHHPNVVILDLTLPGTHGVDVIRGLPGRSEVPIIVLSAHDAEVDKVTDTAGRSVTSRGRDFVIRVSASRGAEVFLRPVAVLEPTEPW